MVRYVLFPIRLCGFLIAVTSMVTDPPRVAGQGLLIEEVTLVDGTGRSPMMGAYVLVEGDRISAVSREPLDAPVGTTRIDGRGRYLIPGLMDMHIHLIGGRGRDGPNEAA